MAKSKKWNWKKYSRCENIKRREIKENEKLVNKKKRKRKKIRIEIAVNKYNTKMKKQKKHCNSIIGQNRKKSESLKRNDPPH